MKGKGWGVRVSVRVGCEGEDGGFALFKSNLTVTLQRQAPADGVALSVEHVADLSITLPPTRLYPSMPYVESQASKSS